MYIFAMYIVQSLIQNLIIFVFMRVCSVVTKSSVPSSNFVTHLSLWSFPMMTPGYTVEPPNKGHFGNEHFVLFSEAVLISEACHCLTIASFQ